MRIRMHSAIAGIILACAAASTAAADSKPSGSSPPVISGFYLPTPLPLTPFALTDHRGKLFTLASLQDHWTLLSFGYTHCPDVCPMTLSQLRAIQKRLISTDPTLRVEVVFVTLDPKRDTPALLANYVTQFDERFVGVGGTPDTIKAFAQQLRVKYEIAPGPGTSYFIDHTSSVALLTPRGELRALFSVPMRPEGVADDVRHVVAAEPRTAANGLAKNSLEQSR